MASGPIDVYVEDIEGTLELYNQIRIYRASSPYSTFIELEDLRTTLVEGQTLYELEDEDGDPSYFYRTTFFNTNTQEESGGSEIQHSNITTLNRLRIEAAIMAGAGFESVATSGSPNSTTLRDITLLDNGVSAKFLEGVWIYRPSTTVALGNKSRRVAINGYDQSDDLTVTRAWGDNGLTNGEAYQVFMFFPPTRQAGATISWQDIVNDAMRSVKIEDNIIVGTGTSTRQTRFDISHWAALITKRNIRTVYLRTTDDNGVITDIEANRKGRYFRIVSNPPKMELEIFPAPSTRQTIVINVNRTFAPLYNDLDVTDCPYELAVRAVKWKAFERLNKLHPGKYAVESSLARSEYLDEWYNHKPTDVVRIS